MTEVFVHLHKPSYSNNSPCQVDCAYSSLRKIRLCENASSLFSGGAVFLSSRHEIIVGAGASTEPSLPSLFCLTLAGQGSHQVLVQLRITGVQLTLPSRGKEATDKGWQRDDFWDSESPKSP